MATTKQVGKPATDHHQWPVKKLINQGKMFTRTDNGGQTARASCETVVSEHLVKKGIRPTPQLIGAIADLVEQREARVRDGIKQRQSRIWSELTRRYT